MHIDKTKKVGNIINLCSPEDKEILVMCGVSHKTSSVEEREFLQVPKSDLNHAVEILKKIEGVNETLILTTCNRIEFYLVLNKQFKAIEIIKQFYSIYHNREIQDYGNLFYVRHGTSVARHIFKVVCGLDSLVLGEYQIQGQVKDAYSIACNAGGPGKIMHRLFHYAFRIGKFVRTETSIGKTKLSTAGVTTNILKEKVNVEDKIVFIGANENIRIIAEIMSKCGYKNFLFINRTVSKADRFAELFGGEGIGLNHLTEVLRSANAIISCSGQPGFVLNSENIEEFLTSQKLKILIDLGMPRNLEITEQIKKKITVVNLENIQDILHYNENNFEEDLKKIEEYFEEQILSFQAWFTSRNDALAGFWAQQIEEIRLQTINEFFREFPENSKEKIEVFSRTLSVRIQNQINQMMNKEVRNKE